MGRQAAVVRLAEIRELMARAGEYRHLSGWAAMGLGFGVSHLRFGAYVLGRYGRPREG